VSPTDVNLSGFDPGYTILTDDLSTAPHGFQFVLLFNANVNTVIIEDPTVNNWVFQVTPSGGFLSNDMLYFSSEAKNKYLYIDRGGEIIHLADSVSFESVWPIMFPGENHFTVSTANLLTWGTIQYTPTYWGI
jgi:hypothetical protein